LFALKLAKIAEKLRVLDSNAQHSCAVGCLVSNALKKVSALLDKEEEDDEIGRKEVVTQCALLLLISLSLILPHKTG
jgi:hypothetical protein